MTTATVEATVEISGARLSVRFDRYDLDRYDLFLRTKTLPESELSYDWEQDTYTLTAPARFAGLLGVASAMGDREPLPLAGHLFDFQRFCVERALDAKRLALWCDTGLGKGPMILEWCRQVVHRTDGRVLILEPLAVIEQLRAEAERFYGAGLPVERLETRADVERWCVESGPGIAITNPQKFIPGVMPELRYLAGLAFDESSMLRTGGGVIKWNVIKSAKGIEYKLSATATPAPNDTMEYASQASFLEKLRNEGEILWTFFSQDKAGNWQVKPHAREAFYRFMSTWSVYMRDPARFGFADILSSLPAPDIREYQVPITPMQLTMMQAYQVQTGRGMFTDRMGVQERSKLSQLAKGFLYDTSTGKRQAALVDSHKPAFVADLVRTDVADGRQVLVWTVFDEESRLLADQLPDVELSVLDGGMSESARLDVLTRFKAGRIPVLVSKSQLLGYGMNFQNCRSMVFSGFDDSFERMYQAVRRAVRFGQTEQVRVHVPYIPELEGMIFTNVKAKESAFLRDVSLQEGFYREALGL